MALVHQFGVFEFNLSAHELRKHGTRVRLNGHPFEILALLLERPGEIVTREDVRARLWPADTYVDFDHSLNTAMKKLRAALGDSPEDSHYIETVRGVGYRFIAPLQLPDRPPDSSGEPEPEAAREVPGTAAAQIPAVGMRSSRAMWLAVAGGILVLGLSALWSETGLIRQPASPTLVRSLAVLPLEDLTNDAQNDYVAEAVTDELITALAKIRALRVISRTSAMRYRKTSKPIGEIARELNVDAIVEGTILRTRSEVHINAQLVRASPEQHLWAESYSRPLGDWMAVEGEIVREIAGAIRITLTPEEQARVSPTQVPPQAFQAYLQGRFFWNKRTPEGFVRATRFFEQAIDKDPLYAAAYAGLADAYILRGGYFAMDQRDAISRARAAAKKALEIDPSLAEAHASLGLIASNFEWNWVEAEREYRRAIELNPNYATAHHWYGEGFLALRGRFDEALAEMNRALELDPLSPMIRVDKGVVYYLARRYDEAIEQYRRALELEPGFPQAHIWLSRAYAAKGMLNEAIKEIEPLRASDSSLMSLSDLGRLYGQVGRRQAALEVLRELRERSENGYIDPACMILVYMGLQDRDQVFAWLEKAYVQHSTAMTSFKVNPLYDPLRSDARFADLERRVRLR